MWKNCWEITDHHTSVVWLYLPWKPTTKDCNWRYHTTHKHLSHQDSSKSYYTFYKLTSFVLRSLFQVAWLWDFRQAPEQTELHAAYTGGKPVQHQNPTVHNSSPCCLYCSITVTRIHKKKHYFCILIAQNKNKHLTLAESGYQKLLTSIKMYRKY